MTTRRLSRFAAAVTLLTFFVLNVDPQSRMEYEIYVNDVLSPLPVSAGVSQDSSTPLLSATTSSISKPSIFPATRQRRVSRSSSFSGRARISAQAI